jgi:hypothetical protein
MKVLLLVCAIMLAVPAVHALRGRPQAVKRTEDGYALLRQCRDADTADSFDAGMCFGFILGTHSGYFIAQTGSQQKLVFCIPSDATNLHTVKAVGQYLNSHPEALHQSADRLVIEAMTAAFPCVEPRPKK